MARSKFSLGVIISGFSFVLSACGSLCPFDNLLENAAHYSVVETGGYSAEGKYSTSPGYFAPPNAWVDNRKLNEFIGKVILSGGVESLKSQYHFRCSAGSCIDCYSCERSISITANHFTFPISMCVNEGEMDMRIAVGPAANVTTMTYWKR